MPESSSYQPSLHHGLDMENLTVSLHESAAIIESQHLLAEVADLSEALWAQSSLAEILVGLVGQAVEVELVCGLRLHGELTSVWREMVLVKSGDFALVPTTHLRSLRASGAQPRLGEPVGSRKIATTLRRLLAHDLNPVLLACGDPVSIGRNVRWLRWVGGEWVGFQSSKGGRFDFEIWSIEKVCAVRFSSLVTPSQVFFDFLRLNTPLPTSTNL